MGGGVGGLNGLWVVALVGGWLVSGVMSDGGRAFNATSLTDVNDGAINLLMESSSRSFTVGDCVENVKRMKGIPSRRYFASFPPEDFVPPGARKWCECLANDPSGIASIPSWPSFGNEDAPKQEFEDAFDRCRASVLDGSDYNTEDICRGMIKLFGVSMARNYVTFCGRFCRSLEDEYLQYDPNYYGGVGGNLYKSCGNPCSAKTMPGYCAKYKLWYTGWYSRSTISFYTRSRDVGVGDTRVPWVSQRSEDFGRTQRRQNAQSVCEALSPLLGSNPNECCNYSRAFALFQQCCSLDSNGKSVFDCEKNFPDDERNIAYDCTANEQIEGFTYDNGFPYCQMLVRGKASLLRDMRVFKRPSTGHFLFEFDEAILDDYAEGNLDCDDRCCPRVRSLNIVANCEDEFLLKYVGRTTRALDGPTPPAGKFVNSDDPCFGLCEDGRDCVLTGNGKAFCADCTALLKPKRSGKDLAECCKYNADTKKCETALKTSGPGICRREEEIFVRSDDGSTEQATFRKSSGFTCMNPRDFRDNGVGCKIVTRAGVPKCVE